MYVKQAKIGQKCVKVPVFCPNLANVPVFCQTPPRFSKFEVYIPVIF